MIAKKWNFIIEDPWMKDGIKKKNFLVDFESMRIGAE